MRGVLLFAVALFAFQAGRAWENAEFVIDLDVIPDVVVPTVDPAPVPSTGKRVLITAETSPDSQIDDQLVGVFKSAPLAEWLLSNGWDARFIDDDTTVVRGNEWFGKALGVIEHDKHWIVIANGDKGFSGPLPNTVEGVQELVGKYN